MQHKTIVLDLIQEQPERHDRLRLSRQPLATPGPAPRMARSS
jgi:hypothetical protein